MGGQASGSLRFAAPIETGAVTTSKGFAPFLASFDDAGGLLWTRSWPVRRGRVGSVSLLDQTLVVSAQFDGTLSFGGVDLPAIGEADWFLATLGADGTEGWATSWGGPRTEYDCASAADAERIATVGSFADVTNFGAGSALGEHIGVGGDAFLLETGLDGARRFVRTWGGDYIDNAVSVALVPHGYVVAGEYYGDIDFGDGALPRALGNPNAYVARFERDGTLVWHRTWEPTSNGRGDGFAIVGVEAHGDELLVFGGFTGRIDFDGTELSSDAELSAAARDAFIMALDADGNALWARSVAAAGSDFATALAPAVPGAETAFVLGGYFSGTADLSWSGAGDSWTSPRRDGCFVAKVGGVQ